MPKFILQDGNEPEFRALDGFTRGYIEALFFTEEAPGVTSEQWQAEGFEPSEGSIPGDVGFTDIAPETLAKLIAECRAFQEANAGLLETAYESNLADGYESEQAGRDFWLTRNGHGAGFWDREALDFRTDGPNIGDALSDAARAAGQRDVYLGDDGKVHI